MTVQNPNWPLMEFDFAFDTGPSSAPPTHWLSLRDRTMGQITTNRGRQYELDQVQTGTWAGNLQNTDAALDPANASSQFYPGVVPYRAFRHRAQYPATPSNILTPDQATAFYSRLGAGGAGSTLPDNVICTAGASHASIVNVSTANHYRVQINNGDAYNGFEFTGFSVEPGATYSVQCQISTSTAAGQVFQMALIYYDMSGNIVSESKSTITPNTSAQTFTVTGTIPAGSSGAILVIEQNGVASPSTFTADIWHVQVEKAASPSTFTVPGTWYTLFTGFVERWPQSWGMNGLFGQSNLVAVDAFGYLSQRKLMSSAYEEFLLAKPTFFYPMDEAAPTSGQRTLVYDLTGHRRSLPVKISPGATADLVLSGSSLQVTTTTGGGFLPQGIPGPVVHFSNNPNGTVGSALDLAVTATVVGPPSNAAWTRVMAFRLGAVANPGSYLWFAADAGFNNAFVITIYNDGSCYGELERSGNIQSFPICGAGGVNVGDWHFIGMSISTDGKTIGCYFDGTNPAFYGSTSDAHPLFGLNGSETLGVDISTGTAFRGFTGDMAMVAEFPSQYLQSDWDALYSALRYGGSGLGSATSASRYQDFLRWGGWNGLQAVDNYTSGETVAYGPATEINAPVSSNGTDVVTALQTVVDTDAGTHYVAVDGTVTFKARRARYNQGTPLVTFGEHTGSGEVPYTVVTTGYDPTRLANDISVVQTQTSQVVRTLDSASANAYGDIQLQRNANTLDPYEQSDAAAYLLRRNSQPVQRVENLSVDVGANPSLWPTMLQLELGSRVRVMRRPPLGAATIQVDGFVEQLNWTIDDKGHAYVDLQISVNNNQQYWQLDSSTYSVLGTTTIVGY